MWSEERHALLYLRRYPRIDQMISPFILLFIIIIIIYFELRMRMQRSHLLVNIDVFWWVYLFIFFIMRRTSFFASTCFPINLRLLAALC